MKKKKVNLRDLKPDSEEQHSHDDGHDNSGNSSDIKAYIPAIISFSMLIIGIALDYFDVAFFKDWLRIVWYGIAYLLVSISINNEKKESQFKRFKTKF